MLDNAQSGTVDSILQIGINHHNSGQPSRAKGYYQQVLDIESRHPDGNNLYARVLILEGDYETALSHVEKALEKKPLEAMYWRTKAEILKNLNRPKEAADAFWRGQDYHNAMNEINAAFAAAEPDDMAYIIKSRVHQDLGQSREAEACLLKAQELSDACLNPYPDDRPDPPIHRPLKVNEERRIGQPNIQTHGFTYVIDIVGTCNLRCPSCPVGNTPRDQREIGFMDVKMYERILEKIGAQGHEKKPEIWLFNWGEPLIHPEIGKIVRMTKKNGYHVFLSSNLNVDHGLRDAIREHPDQLKISLSGFNQEVYRQTHSKGNIDRVKGNMYLLKYYLEKYRAPTWIWVSFHMYRHNMADYQLMEAFTKELGFTFNPITAFYQPLEKLVSLFEGKTPNDQKKVLDLLIQHPLDHKLTKMPFYRKAQDCELRYNMISINYNGVVDLCCSTFNDENTIGVNYLDADFDEIQRRKYEHPFCVTCYKHGLNYQALPAEGNKVLNNDQTHMVNNVLAALNSRR